MLCGRAKGLLAGLIYGELSEELAAEVREHMRVCPACAEEYRRLQETCRALDSATAPQASEAHKQAVTDMLAREGTARDVSWSDVWGVFVQLGRASLPLAYGLVAVAVSALLLSSRSHLVGVAPSYLLIIGAVWGGSYTTVFRFAAGSGGGGVLRPTEAALLLLRQMRLNTRGIFYAGVGGLTLAVFFALLMPAPAAYELPNLRPWYYWSCQLTPYWLSYWMPGAYAFAAMMLTGFELGKRITHARGMHAFLAGGIYSLAMVPGIITQCVPFKPATYLAWAFGSLLGAMAGATAGVFLGARGRIET